jgi:hypothetical protein
LSEPDADADMSETLQNDGCGDAIPPQYIIGTWIETSLNLIDPVLTKPRRVYIDLIEKCYFFLELFFYLCYQV